MEKLIKQCENSIDLNGYIKLNLYQNNDYLNPFTIKLNTLDEALEIINIILNSLNDNISILND